MKMSLTLHPEVFPSLPKNTIDSVLMQGSFQYYHYKCDTVDDRGWGCGYRTLQSICSWIQRQIDGDCQSATKIPSIVEIQKALVDIGDKNVDFIGSNMWIGSIEVAYCVDYFYKISCKIRHAKEIKDLYELTNEISNHFLQNGSPLMMGGNIDCSSKGILGLSRTSGEIYLLILDPHYSGVDLSQDLLIKEGWLKWRNLQSLVKDSFYNLCFPLLKARS